jgi:hypothetical protein
LHVGFVHPQLDAGAGAEASGVPQGHWKMGQQSLEFPTTTGGTFPAQTGIASVQAAGLLGSQFAPSGSQRNAGQQSSTAVPIQRCVPGGHTGAGVVGQAVEALQIGWQVTWAQQSAE